MYTRNIRSPRQRGSWLLADISLLFSAFAACGANDPKPEIRVQLDDHRWAYGAPRAAVQVLPVPQSWEWHEAQGGYIVYPEKMPVRCVIIFFNEGNFLLAQQKRSADIVFSSADVDPRKWVKLAGAHYSNYAGQWDNYLPKDMPRLQVSLGEELYAVYYDTPFPKEQILNPGQNRVLYLTFEKRAAFWKEGKWIVGVDVQIPGYPLTKLDLRFQAKEIRSKADEGNYYNWAAFEAKRAKNDSKLALEFFDKFLAISPNDGPCLKEKAWILSNQGEFAASAEVWQRLLSLFQERKLHRGISLLRADTREEKIAQLQAHVKDTKQRASLKAALAAINKPLSAEKRTKLIEMGKWIGYHPQLTVLYCQKAAELNVRECLPAMVGALERDHAGKPFRPLIWNSIAKLSDLDPKLFDPSKPSKDQKEELKRIIDLCTY